VLQDADSLLAACAAALRVQPTPPAHALLTAGDPIKNAQAILRYALPIDNKPIRQIQVRGQDLKQRVHCGTCPQQV
jgi:hypothetical protein